MSVPIGKLADANAQRDAIHIAIAPVMAGHRLAPASWVKMKDGSMDTVISAAEEHEVIGIVDPFLSAPVRKGERFYMLLMPETVTGMRHEWQHPAFMVAPAASATTTPTKAESETWLKRFCDSHDCPGYEQVIGAITALNDGKEYDMGDGYFATLDSEYFHFQGTDAHDEILPEFWDHAERVIGKKIKMRAASFSCSC